MSDAGRYAGCGARHTFLLAAIACSLLMPILTEARAGSSRPPLGGTDHQPRAGIGDKTAPPAPAHIAPIAPPGRPPSLATAQSNGTGDAGAAVINGITAPSTATDDADTESVASAETSSPSIGTPSPIGGLVVILLLIAAIVVTIGGLLALSAFGKRFLRHRAPRTG